MAVLALIHLAGRGPDLERAAAALGALPEARVVRVEPEVLAAGLDTGAADVLVGADASPAPWALDL